MLLLLDLDQLFLQALNRAMHLTSSSNTSPVDDNQIGWLLKIQVQQKDQIPLWQRRSIILVEESPIDKESRGSWLIEPGNNEIQQTASQNSWLFDQDNHDLGIFEKIIGSRNYHDIPIDYRRLHFEAFASGDPRVLESWNTAVEFLILENDGFPGRRIRRDLGGHHMSIEEPYPKPEAKHGWTEFIWPIYELAALLPYEIVRIAKAQTPYGLDGVQLEMLWKRVQILDRLFDGTFIQGRGALREILGEQTDRMWYVYLFCFRNKYDQLISICLQA